MPYYEKKQGEIISRDKERLFNLKLYLEALEKFNKGMEVFMKLYKKEHPEIKEFKFLLRVAQRREKDRILSDPFHHCF